MNSRYRASGPSSGQSGTWTRDLRIASPALKPLGHAASYDLIRKLDSPYKDSVSFSPELKGLMQVSDQFRLPTYPSPKPTSRLKWEVSVNICFGEG